MTSLTSYQATSTSTALKLITSSKPLDTSKQPTSAPLKHSKKFMHTFLSLFFKLKLLDWTLETAVIASLINRESLPMPRHHSYDCRAAHRITQVKNNKEFQQLNEQVPPYA